MIDWKAAADTLASLEQRAEDIRKAWAAYHHGNGRPLLPCGARVAIRTESAVAVHGGDFDAQILRRP